MTAEQMLHDLAQVVRDAFPDRDFPAEVGPRTRFFADLDLASIDAVVLAEQVERHYGRKLPFNAFLGGLRQRGASDFELGELVAFLQEQMS